MLPPPPLVAPGPPVPQLYPRLPLPSLPSLPVLPFLPSARATTSQLPTAPRIRRAFGNDSSGDGYAHERSDATASSTPALRTAAPEHPTSPLPQTGTSVAVVIDGVHSDVPLTSVGKPASPFLAKASAAMLAQQTRANAQEALQEIAWLRHRCHPSRASASIGLWQKKGGQGTSRRVMALKTTPTHENPAENTQTVLPIAGTDSELQLGATVPAGEATASHGLSQTKTMTKDTEADRRQRENVGLIDVTIPRVYITTPAATPPETATADSASLLPAPLTPAGYVCEETHSLPFTHSQYTGLQSVMVPDRRPPTPAGDSSGVSSPFGPLAEIQLRYERSIAAAERQRGDDVVELYHKLAYGKLA